MALVFSTRAVFSHAVVRTEGQEVGLVGDGAAEGHADAHQQRCRRAWRSRGSGHPSGPGCPRPGSRWPGRRAGRRRETLTILPGKARQHADGAVGGDEHVVGPAHLAGAVALPEHGAQVLAVGRVDLDLGELAVQQSMLPSGSVRIAATEPKKTSSSSPPARQSFGQFGGDSRPAECGVADRGRSAKRQMNTAEKSPARTCSADMERIPLLWIRPGKAGIRLRIRIR